MIAVRRLCTTAALALCLFGGSAQGAILVSAEEPAPEDVIADVISCVAAVLAYQTGDAQTFCSRVITSMPDEPLGYKYRGLSYLLEHRFDKAEPDFRAAARIAPEDPENEAGYGQSLSGQGRYEAAIPHFDAALEIAPQDVRYLAARCWARAGQGGDDNLVRALADCNRAADLAPDYPTARLNRGMVRLKQKQWRTAIQDYTRAMDMGGALPSGLFGRGFAWLQLKEIAQGRADILAARKDDPRIDELFIRVGVLPASCREAKGECPLPAEVRQPNAGGPFVMVSYQPMRTDSFHELDDYVRRIALGRMDAMLDRTAELLGTSSHNTYSPPWEDADPALAIHHIQRIQLEYRRQQGLACAAGVVSGRLCEQPDFHASSALADDPFSLRTEVDHTFDAVQPFWKAVCRAKRGVCPIE